MTINLECCKLDLSSKCVFTLWIIECVYSQTKGIVYVNEQFKLYVKDEWN